MKKKIKDFWGIVLDMVFPRRCAICDDLLPFGRTGICSGCEGKLLYVKEPRCRKCGAALTGYAYEYCGSCRETKHGFTRAVSVFIYNDAIRKSIYRFKYGGRQEYAYFYAEEICRYLGREIRSFEAEVLLPVPLHVDRFRERGYNQAALVARRMGEILGIRVDEKLLRRETATIPQKNLSREQRRKNLKKAFKLARNDVKLTRVIIVDDIYTTGTTVDELSQLLRSVGVREVFVVTVCSGVPV